MNSLRPLRMLTATLAGWLAAGFLASATAAETKPSATPSARRILVVGDSITYGGQYVEYFEAFLALRFPEWRGELFNLGLPSETVSGLSEDGHAGGKFPRPDLHERFDRVLAKIKPDLVVACYGMNDGIYQPFSEERAAKFQEGMRWLRAKSAAAGAQVIHLTPPTFDPAPGKDWSQVKQNYNDVLDRYSDWLLAQRAQGWTVLDIHGPMNLFLSEHRRQNPGYKLAGDGIHPNETGHWQMALPLLLHFGAPAEFAAADNAAPLLAMSPSGAELLKLVQQRQRMLKDAWLTDTGHQRPGMSKGMPLAQAQQKAAELETQIRALMAPLPVPEIRRDALEHVRISCAATGFVIRYTLDDSDPTRDAGAYLAPIALPGGGTVKARTFGAGDLAKSAVVSARFEALGGAVRPHSALLPVTQNRDWRSYDWPTRHAAVCALVRERKPEIVFIGDSITHFWGGEPAARQRNGPEVWEKFYTKRNAVNLGFGWDRTENVLWRLQHGELDGAAPKVVVLLIGTNNLDTNTPDEIADGIRAICGELHARLPQTKILLLSILPRGQKPNAHRAKLAEVNARTAKLDGQGGVTVLDIGAKFLQPDGSIAADVMNDFLHPTAKGYAIFAEAIEPALAKWLGDAKPATPPPFPGKQTSWHGFDRYDFDAGGKMVAVIVPARPLPGKLWAWKGEFLDAFPATEIALLHKGVHIVYLQVPDLLGSPEAVQLWSVCYQELTGKHGLAKKPALIALSRAGLYCYNWAAANPDKVSCVYADAAVCDFKSWPGGKGKGKGSARDWKLVLERYGFASEAEALAYRKNPIDNLEPLAKAKVPLFHVYGDADDVVPWEENTGIVAERYRKLGGEITLIGKPGVSHHPHGLPDPTPVVEFILKQLAK